MRGPQAAAPGDIDGVHARAAGGQASTGRGTRAATLASLLSAGQVRGRTAAPALRPRREGAEDPVPHHVLWGAPDDLSVGSSGSSSNRASSHQGRGARRRAIPSDVHFECGSSDGGEVPSEAQPIAEASRLGAPAPCWAAPSVPSDAGGAPTSLGSRGHQAGACVPCVFALTAAGCPEGAACEFCHFPHADPRPQGAAARKRPCKGQRARYQKQIARLEDLVQESPETFDPQSAELPPSITANLHLKGRVIGRLQELKDKTLAENALAAAGEAGLRPQTQSQAGSSFLLQL